MCPAPARGQPDSDLCLCPACAGQDIVTESESFDVERFIPQLQKYIRRTNPYIRQLLVGGGAFSISCSLVGSCLFGCRRWCLTGIDPDGWVPVD